MSRPRATLASLVIAPVTLLAMILLPAGGAQASATASPAASLTLSQGGPRPGHAAHSTPGRRAASPNTAAAGARNARRVCAAPKRGFAACMSLVRTNVPRHRGPFGPAQTPSGYGPADLQSAYALPSGIAGSGQTVAIVDAYDDPTAEADLQAYRAQYGLPTCTTANGCFEKVNQDGQQGSYPAPNSGWAEEESLDVDMVSAICPTCHILLVEANSSDNNDMYAAENEAVALGAKYVSNSWGEAEYPGEQQDDQYFNHPGVVITFAGGDYGYLGRGTANWPAASQYVTAVGGTSLTRDPSTPRGWDETAWTGTGSGCSLYEPKPAWQHDTGCANRTSNDVSADADPGTGVAVYDSGIGGWAVFGGTSVATPIIASTYALAGPPAAGTYPSSYPYADPAALNDVTSGSNGTCSPAYLCTAGPGYDGPTGLGTPQGVAAFQPAFYGTVAGTVTKASFGQPLSGAEVRVAGFSVTTDSAGRYSVTVPVGSYTVTTSDFGYASKSAGVVVSQGQTATENFALAAVPFRTLSGTVRDGSGHEWPLYAKITVSGDPHSPFYTNPYTGAYSISLPGHSTSQLQVTSVSPGYLTKNQSVHMGTTDEQRDISLTVDKSACDAPGYADPLHQDFDVAENTLPTGWSVTDNLGQGYEWTLSDRWNRGNQTGGQGNFAIADALQANEDALLTSPVFSLAKVTSPILSFDTAFRDDNPGGSGTYAEVDLSTDGGQTWASIWRNTSGITGPDTVSIPVPQAAGQSQVRVRFHYVSNSQGFWEVDDVLIGPCGKIRGGLVAGMATDANTGDGLNGTAVASAARSAETTTTAAAPSVGDGFYELFAAGTGSQQFTATDNRYAPATATVNVTANAVTRQDFSLQAGHVTVTPASISATTTLGNSASSKVTFTNDGTKPAHVTLAGQDDGFTAMGGPSQAKLTETPVQRVRAHLTPGVMKPRSRMVGRPRPGLQRRRPAPSDTPWANLAGYPIPISDNAVAYGNSTGQVYSVGGFADLSPSQPYTNVGYVYNPVNQQWSPIAAAPQALDSPVAAFTDGTLYLIGGWDNNSDTSQSVYAYHPATYSWSQVASLPTAVAGPGVAVLNGQIYVVGGCTDFYCDQTAAVQRYDPGSNTWTQLADYPTDVVSWEACGGIDGQVVCAGGINNVTGQALSSTYRYNPVTGAWTAGADMPYPNWAMAYADANGRLQVASGANGLSTLTNQAAEYDPAANTWLALPNANSAEYRGGGACGLYQVGGTDYAGNALSSAEVLPGYGTCGTAAQWLSESSGGFELAPGQSVTVTVTLDSSGLSQPGSYAASLVITTDTPYQDQPVPVTLQATPPATWGKIAGTVTDAATGQPIPGATVQICTLYDRTSGTCGPVTYTATTDASGYYQWWLAQGYNPLQVIASKNGYQPQARIVKITKGDTTTLNFPLTASP